MFFIKKIAENLEVGEAIISKKGENSENMLLPPLSTHLMSETSVILSIIYSPPPRVKTLKTISESEPSHSHPVSENSENS